MLVLENLVDVEEVDEELREEVKIECEKFGEVSNCLIHILAGNSGIRVFVEFKQL